MPEGDTIYRAARTLNRALAGMIFFGEFVGGVSARGKHERECSKLKIEN